MWASDGDEAGDRTQAAVGGLHGNSGVLDDDAFSLVGNRQQTAGEGSKTARGQSSPRIRGKWPLPSACGRPQLTLIPDARSVVPETMRDVEI